MKASTAFLKDYETLSVQPVSYSQSAAPKKATSTDTVIEVLQQILPASCHRACPFVTADTQQGALPQATTGVSGLSTCEATVTAPPEALLTA